MVANVKQMKLITGEEILCDLTEALYDEEDELSIRYFSDQLIH